MSHEEQLGWETRVGRFVAPAAFLAALLLIVSAIVEQKAKLQPGAVDGDSVDYLFRVYDHKGAFVLSGLLQAVGVALIGPPLWFLYKVSKYRRPEVPAVARILALVPIFAGLLQIVHLFDIASGADTVHSHLTSNPLPPDDANDYVSDQFAGGVSQVVGMLGIAAGLAVAFAFVVNALNAMRAGILSRFMGFLGMIVGFLFVIPLFGGAPVAMVFWLTALGLLFLDRWPQGGRGPAWETGEAIPWPTAADRQARIAEERAEREAQRPASRKRRKQR